MSNPLILKATPNAISLLVSESGATRFVNQDGLTVDLFGQVVAHANPLAQQATGGGVTDERHLWPAWFNLIRECRPSVIFGEQVEAAVNHGWLDLVQTDLEGEDYACGAVGLPAGGVGAPHIRQRLWFVAESLHHGNMRIIGDSIGKKSQNQSGGARIGIDEARDSCTVSELADSDSGRHNGWATATGQQEGASTGLASSSTSGELGNNNNKGSQGHGEFGEQHDATRWQGTQRYRTSAGFWDSCDWLPCRDGKARPVEPGTFPLAHGSTARVGRLRAYGNAIVPQVAQAFIEAYLES